MRVFHIALCLLLLGPAGETTAYPACRAGKSLQQLEAELTRKDTSGLLFHPWLTLRLFQQLEREGLNVPWRYRVQAVIGSVEEDLDIDRCSLEKSYAELATTDPVPGTAEQIQASVASAREFLESWFGFPVEEWKEHLRDWEFYARIGLLAGVKSQRVLLFRQTLKDYPHHRAENHFLSSQENARRGLVEQAEWVMVERNVSALEWANHPDNLCGARAMQDAVSRKQWDRAFRVLGHLLHLLQDMGVPAHVRNDTHAPIPHPWAFLSSLFGEAGLDLRGDRSLDWFDPLEKHLTSSQDAFGAYEKLSTRCGWEVQPVGAGTDLKAAFEGLRKFTATHFYSRDTVLRTQIAGAHLDDLNLADVALHEMGEAGWCLKNDLQEPVACVEQDVLENHDLSVEARSIVFPGTTVTQKLVSSRKLRVTAHCVQRCLCRTVPLVESATSAWAYSQIRTWAFGP